MSAAAPPWKLLALPPLPVELLTALFADVPVELVVPAERTAAEVAAAAEDAEIVLGDWSGGLALDAGVIAAARRLAFVQQPSAGVDAIDAPALTAAGVPLANAGSANAVSVAEWCVGATFAVLRSLAYADAELRAGRWPQLELARRGGGELAGRRVGVIGMGPIGRECASRFVALGCDVAHWSRTQRPPEAAGGARWLPLDELLAHAQVLVVVVALGPETRNLISEQQLALLPPGAMLVNAARGGIVDEAALLAAVRDGRIAGAALDVFATEPLPADSPLRGEDRLLLSPHAAGASAQAQARLIANVVENVRRATAGEPVNDVVNGLPPLIERRR
ncbi:MAG TPA: NAD(P)-dependent oxidoreductase [Mycobacteriales bacterium]|nr:NAD(P)-dependent oxidoreductase [Mycobacteriales bacterium]